MNARTIAIGDIHGCSAALDTLLEVIRPSPEDTLVTLGDYIYRGPDSRGVIERLIIEGPMPSGPPSWESRGNPIRVARQ